MYVYNLTGGADVLLVDCSVAKNLYRRCARFGVYAHVSMDIRRFRRYSPPLTLAHVCQPICCFCKLILVPRTTGLHNATNYCCVLFVIVAIR